MIECLEFRRRVGAEPSAADAEVVAHREGCAACARYHDELRAMDALIARALAIEPVRARGTRSGAGAPTPARHRWFAIAASLFVGLAVGLVLLTSAPRESMARDVFDHIRHEPGTMASTAPVAPGALAAVLDPDGTRLHPGVGDVTFAARCKYESRVVPHLVVRTPQGPVTVLILRHRQIDEPMRIEDRGLHAVILPAPRGSLAIVGEGIADLEDVARKVFDAVDWGA